MIWLLNLIEQSPFSVFLFWPASLQYVFQLLRPHEAITTDFQYPAIHYSHFVYLLKSTLILTSYFPPTLSCKTY
jgi:hypothetical protein